MNCLFSSALTISVISTLCSWTSAKLPVKFPAHHKGPAVDGKSPDGRSFKLDSSLSTNLVNVECHVGALCLLQNRALSKLDKTLIPSWLIMKDNKSSTFHGIPTGNDVGTHILPEIGLVVQVTFSARELAFPCRPYRTSPTVAVISIDADLPVMPPAVRISLFTRLVNLLRSGSPYIDLKSIYYLSKATHQPESLKSLFMLATGPGNTHSFKTNGSLLAWRVGCGSVAPSQLSSLQRLEKTAVTGELARIIGYPVRQWFVADDKRVLVEARRMRRNRMKRSPNIDQWGPHPEMYKQGDGSGYLYEYNGVGEYASGFYPPEPDPGSRINPVIGPDSNTPRTDTLPTSKKLLPLYMVKQNVKNKKFRIPEYTFYDKEDGSTANMRLELLTKDQITVNDMEPRWLTLDSASQTITVIDPSLVSRGNHSFSLVAYDSNDNRVSQLLVIRVLPSDSSEPMAVIKFKIRPGEYFTEFLGLPYQNIINHNIDDDKNLRSFSLLQIDAQGKYINSSNPWLRFDSEDMKFYGFPTLDLTDYKTNFRLFVRMKYASRSINSPSGFFRVEITITSRRQKGLTHSIGMNVTNPNFSADRFLRDPWLQVEFVKKLKKVFNEKSVGLFLIQNVTKTYRRRYRRQSSFPRNDMVTINWAHRAAFAKDGRCNVHALKIIMNRLFEIQGNRVVWRQNTAISMRPFSLHDFKVKALGVCEPYAVKFIPTPQAKWLKEKQTGSIVIETPKRTNPQKERTLLPIIAYVGVMFRKRLMTEDASEVNLAGKTLKFLDEVNSTSINKTGSRGKVSWMKICDNMLCGLAMNDNIGVKLFDIGVQDSNSDEVSRYQIPVNVQRYTYAKNLNHRVSMNVYPEDGDFRAWYLLDNRLKFLRHLELYLDPNCDQGYGKSCGQGISFLRMVEKSGEKLRQNANEAPRWDRLLEIDWAWTELYINGGCPRKRLRRLKDQLYTESRFSRIIHLGRAMQKIGLRTVAISVGYSGECLYEGNESFTQSTLIAKGDGGGFSTWKILVIVGTILVLIILPAVVIAMLRIRNSRRNKKEGAEATVPAAALSAVSRTPDRASSSRMKEREPLSKKPVHRPTMFNDEMDDAPSAPTKPLILPHEKPPVPPPDFGVMDLNCARPSPSASSRSSATTMPRRPLNPYRNMPPNFDDRGARHV